MTDWDRAFELLHKTNTAQQRLLEGAHGKGATDLSAQAQRPADALAGLDELAATIRKTNEPDQG